MSLTYRWPILGSLRLLRALQIACEQRHADRTREGSAIFQASGCRFTTSEQACIRPELRVDSGNALGVSGRCVQFRRLVFASVGLRACRAFFGRCNVTRILVPSDEIAR